MRRTEAVAPLRTTDAVALARRIDSMNATFRESRERRVIVVQTSPVVRHTMSQCFVPEPGFFERYRKERAAKRRAAMRSWILETLTSAYFRRWIREDALNRGWFRRESADPFESAVCRDRALGRYSGPTTRCRG